MSLISSFGTPPTEFSIYINCTYQYNGQNCTVLEFPENFGIQTPKAKVKFSDGSIVMCKISDITPVPLDVDYLDSIANTTSVDLSIGIKEWSINFNIPCTIRGDGQSFVYSNPVMQNKGDAPIRIVFISDWESVQNSFDQDPNANKIYEYIKKGVTD